MYTIIFSGLVTWPNSTSGSNWWLLSWPDVPIPRRWRRKSRNRLQIEPGLRNDLLWRHRSNSLGNHCRSADGLPRGLCRFGAALSHSYRQFSYTSIRTESAKESVENEELENNALCKRREGSAWLWLDSRGYWLETQKKIKF